MGSGQTIAPAPPTDPAQSLPYQTLKGFLAENASLIFFVGSLTSLATFVVNLELGWLGTYIKSVLLGAAVIVWFEFHAQWPEPLRLDHPGKVHPQRTYWRLEIFSFLMQLLPVLFAIWAVAQAPEILIPIVAIGLAVALCRRFAVGHRHRTWLLVAIVVAGFLASELVLERIYPHQTTLLDLGLADIAPEVEMVQPDI